MTQLNRNFVRITLRHVLKSDQRMFKSIGRRCIKKENQYIWMDNILCQMKMGMWINPGIWLRCDYKIMNLSKSNSSKGFRILQKSSLSPTNKLSPEK